MPDVDLRHLRVDPRSIIIGEAVEAATWNRVGQGDNWLLGRCRTLVPPFRPDHGTLVWAGSTGGSGNLFYGFSYAFRMLPTIQAVERLWLVRVESEDDLRITVSGGGGTTVVSEGGTGIHLLRQSVSSQTSSESDAVLTLDSREDITNVSQIGCWEIPRAQLATDATDLGVNLELLRAGQPILEDGLANIRDTLDTTTPGRRVLFHWANPYDVGGVTSTTHVKSTSSTLFSNVWPDFIPAIIRKLTRGETSRSVSARFYAWVTGGGGGEIRMNGDVHGLSSAVVISNTSPAWSGTISDLDLNVEDTSAEDGLASGVWDGFNVQFRATAGTLYVASAVVFEG